MQVLKRGFQQKYDEKGLNCVSLDGAEWSIDTFRKHTKSGGLFIQKRFIILTGLWSLSKDQQEQLHAELDSIDADNILCISADAPPRKNNALFKRLLEVDMVEAYPELNGNELRQFITSEVESHGATIEPGAIQWLMNHCEGDTWQLHYEIKKLAFAGSPITQEAAQSSVQASVDDNIFALTDALGAKNAKRASALLDEQFALGNNEHYILTMIARHISLLLKVSLSEPGTLKQHPFVLQKAEQQSRAFTIDRLKMLQSKLLQIDQKLKTSNADARTLLQLFIIAASA